MAPVATLTVDEDDALAAALADDVRGGFDQLVLAMQDRLYGFALRLCGSPADAEEIVQDAFLRTYRALQDYPPERVRDLRLRPWLYHITLNVLRNRLRGRKPREVSLEEPGAAAAVLGVRDPGEGPEAALGRHERWGVLAAALLRLPLRYRAPVALRHVQGLTYPEASAALGQPLGTVKANVHRGLKLLRADLERSGYFDGRDDE